MLIWCTPVTWIAAEQGAGGVGLSGAKRRKLQNGDTPVKLLVCLGRFRDSCIESVHRDCLLELVKTLFGLDS